MELFLDYGRIGDTLTPCAVTIGSFDGLHLGHRLLIEKAKFFAEDLGVVSCVMTFEPHPAKALAPGLSPPLLMSYHRKIRALEKTGIGRILSQRFTHSFASLTPKDFAQKVLYDSLRARVVVVGDDFSFGHKGQGRTEDLRALGRSLGFDVEVVQRLTVEGIIASSTRIRSFILQGRVQAARLLLGRPYTIAGQVVSGAGRGRKLGIPTANLRTDAELLPARGVYMCHVWKAGWSCGKLAVTNIGTNPTFGGVSQTIEAHVLDMDEDLLAQPLAIAFLQRLRGEIVFSSASELVAQIHRDESRARDLASKYPIEPKLHDLSGIDLDTEPFSQG